MEHVVSTTVTAVTGNRKEVTDLALGLVILTGTQQAYFLVVTWQCPGPHIATKGTNQKDLKAKLGVEPRVTPSVRDVDMVQKSILSRHQPGGSHAKDGGTQS